ncbi:hypothetical protein E6W36_02415 [Hankyongella ginsenosidimutans]|uniref:Uncharacterized protein n=1 Tax=Hankyongella ginsenosidimutans TaxID=1763828 RepID=A0A4D7C1G7_9SPHN|nr:hypothetical protein E6W36_02415 [Hankyongella ginsenosidimutans]
MALAVGLGCGGPALAKIEFHPQLEVRESWSDGVSSENGFITTISPAPTSASTPGASPAASPTITSGGSASAPASSTRTATIWSRGRTQASSRIS